MDTIRAVCNSTINTMLAVAAMLTGCGSGSVAAKDTLGSGWVPGYGTLPIRFEPNIGQAPPPIKYLARGHGYTVAVTEAGAIVRFSRDASRQMIAQPATHDRTPRKSPAGAWVRLSLLHARREPLLRAEMPQTSVSNYFIGDDPSKWRSNVANYSAIRYEQVYPGIDWVVYGNPHQLEYDFVVSPKADPRRIGLKIEGARLISVDGHGDLLVKMQNKSIRQLKPVMYQTAPDGTRQPVDCRYVLDHQHVAFALGDYDHSRQLVIDPTFVYSTYLGGSGGDAATAIAVDGAGNAYVAGSTTSMDFPTLEPFQGTTHNRQWGNAFVTKFNSTGTALIYSTYLGGSGNSGFDGDGANAIAVDAAGNAYIAGFTTSTDFPTVNPFQAVNNAASNEGANAFLVKLNAAGSGLVYSTYFGGSGRSPLAYDDSATAIAVDVAGNAYIAGRTTSTDFPTRMPLQATNKATGLDSTTAFVAKFNTAGSALVYSTYLGGSTPGNGTGDSANAIAVDGTGSAYVVGATSASDFPTVAAVQTVNRAVGLSHGGVGNAFVTKFNANGSALVYSTYLGGSVNDSGRAVAVDAQGNSYVAGYTQSSDFPTTNAWQAANKAVGGGANAFVTKLNATGSAFVYSTYLGGINDEANAIAVDLSGNAYVAGSTFSNNFPLADALQSTNKGANHGSSNAFISVFDATGLTLKFSTYLGGSGSVSAIQPDCNCAPIYDGDSAAGIAVDARGNLYVAGSTYSTDFPTAMAFQDTNTATNTGTSGTAFVVKIAMTPPAPQWSMRGGGGAIGWGWLGVLGLTVAVRCGGSRRLSPS